MREEPNPCPICGGELAVALHNNESGWYWWTIQRGPDDETACRCRLFVESDEMFTLEENEKPEDIPRVMDIRERLVRKFNNRVCELEEVDVYDSTREPVHVLECSACGQTCEHINGSYEYCPHCGRKVVDK